MALSRNRESFETLKQLMHVGIVFGGDPSTEDQRNRKTVGISVISTNPLVILPSHVIHEIIWGIQQVVEHLLVLQDLIWDVGSSSLHIQELMTHFSNHSPLLVIFHEEHPITSRDQVLRYVQIGFGRVNIRPLVHEFLDSFV